MRWALTVVIVALAGCGAGGSAPPETSSMEAAAVHGALRELERAGTLPVLDRSDSIAGPDSNANGVRDDIEQWVASRSDWNSLQVRAAIQSARSFQAFLTTDLKDEDRLQRASEAHWEALVCLGRHFEPLKRAHALDANLEAMTMNTYQRSKRYALYNSARHGGVTLKPQGDTCLP